MAAVALRKSLRTTTILTRTLSTLTTTTTPRPTHHKDHSRSHVYLKPTTLIGSFLQTEPPQTPKQALAKLAFLRHDYGKQVKELRRQYIDEMEVQRLEKVRKIEAIKLEIVEQKKERRKEKAVRAKARALERKAFDQNFRLTLRV